MLLLFLAKTAGALLNPNAAGALILRGRPQLLPKPVVARAAPQVRGGALPGLRERVSTNSGVKEGLISLEPLQPLGMPRLPRAGRPLPEAAPVTCRQGPASSSQLPRSLIGRNSRATGFEARPICKGCILPAAIFPQAFFILQVTHRTVGTLSSLLGACLWLPRLKKSIPVFSAR